MARTQTIQASFNSGELSPKLSGRVDIERYQSGLQTLLNFRVSPQGGVTRREGFRYLADAYSHTVQGLLVDFEFSQDQVYALEFSEQKIRFFYEDGQVLTVPIINAITQAAQAQVTFTEAHRIQVGQTVTFYLVEGMTEINGLSGTVQSIPTSTQIVVDIDTSTFTAYTGGGEAEAVYQIDSPYTEEQLPFLKWRQSFDVMYFAMSLVEPHKLSRLDHDNWTMEAISFTSPPSEWAANDYPRCLAFFEERLYWAGSPSYPKTFWASKSGDYEDHSVNSPLQDDDAFKYTISSGKNDEIHWMATEDRLILGTPGGEWLVSGQTAAEGIVATQLPWVRKNSSAGSSPVTPVQFDEGMVFVKKIGKKMMDFLFQQTRGKYVPNDITRLASHLFTKCGVDEMVYADQPDHTIWLTREDGDLIGCTIMREENVLGFHPHDTGADGRFESVCSIPGRTEDRLYAYVKRIIDGQERRYIELKEVTFDEDVSDFAFFVDSGLTYNEPHIITDITQASPAVVTLYNPDHGLQENQVVQIFGVEGMIEINFARVKVKNISGQTVELYELDDTPYDTTGFTAYKESGTLEETADTFAGLDHLEGMTVGLLVDGGTYDDQVVENGQISIGRIASRVHIGLKFTSKFETLSLDSVEAIGAIQGKVKSVAELTMKLYKTLGGYIAGKESDLKNYPIFLKSDQELIGRPPDMLTENYSVDFPGEWDRDAHIWYMIDEPVPATVLGVYGVVEVE